ncbi:hypothetical protein CEXT_260101 [Caerostris extrusa]|uniref:Uncharacterized protein n=1 Tax=Caerostris extrusa TaxID=172846 RepID=A0AAV4VQF0_CAEEX|nr:hypothetical protein CEXT_260101 [Caerostris extrusa]
MVSTNIGSWNSNIQRSTSKKLLGGWTLLLPDQLRNEIIPQYGWKGEVSYYFKLHFEALRSCTLSPFSPTTTVGCCKWVAGIIIIIIFEEVEGPEAGYEK